MKGAGGLKVARRCERKVTKTRRKEMNRQGLSCSSTASSIESSQQAPPNSRDPTATPSPAQTPRGEVRGYYARTPRRERKPALRARRRGREPGTGRAGARGQSN
ncbi:Hypothetical protein NTJ_02141 [Nesidiocoris tenuis]|uniref:Uncharacterized protein n=1 Tax=Nesidiocoris tenuis TaxID=355587 RepID=A0ABN7ABE5_9HEMI|nr:Hypothetical protein NTJ_02141 [Nesidiocoris tenuis]